jgi:hypothetical protein
MAGLLISLPTVVVDVLRHLFLGIRASGMLASRKFAAPLSAPFYHLSQEV